MPNGLMRTRSTNAGAADAIADLSRAVNTWMRSNGYPTVAVYYASVQAIGFPYQYMALIGGAWELVHRVGA